MNMMRTSSVWCTGAALVATVAMQPVEAAPVAIDDLYIDSIELSVSLTTPPAGTLFSTGPQTIAPPIMIDMGVYQDPIVSGSLGSGITWKIYSTGDYGAPVPSGTVDGATGDIDVDLSSLRLNISGIVNPSLPSTFDVELWPVTTPATSGSYDPLDDSWSLLWSKTFSITVQDLGNIGGTIDLALGGTLTTVPVPAAVWLFGSGLLGLVGIARRKKVV